ncbi:DUF2732 family protein [Yersinia enterocolitica]|nr:DUF2732 family protein [Yersinia enterocolitica]EKN6182307.1 DUF2732 family protein [Yersinia enterocolitica]EKN6384483.1 DUF2732 family protein [Yersinia enterocolitica]ELW7360378.1 DUF2732 family protein [Yersinia enterocolitica]HEF7269688.1 DUF2732 family protein [Yersinia enterocolitica]
MKNIKQQAELIRYEHSPVAMNSLELLLNEARIDERKNQAALVSSRLEEIANQILNRELNGVEAAELLNQIAEHIITQSYDQH